jgi:hypothetical protein
MYMDVNEHERVETIQVYTLTQIKVKKQCFYYCSTFHSHSRIFNNEHTVIHILIFFLHLSGTLYFC